MQLGTQNLVITCSISASTTSYTFDWYIGIVIRQLVTSSIMHKINSYPLLDLGITLRSILSLDKGL